MIDTVKRLADLHDEIERIVHSHESELIVGVAAQRVGTDDTLFLNADEIFPTASVIKVAIVCELYTQVYEGRLSLDTVVEATAESMVAGSGVLASLTPGLKLPLCDLATLAITVSDNTASNLCLAAVGGAAVINQRMHGEWQMPNTTIHRPIRFKIVPTDPPHTATGTPRDMLRLMTLLHEGKIGNRATSDAVLALLEKCQAEDMLPRYLNVNPFADDLSVERPPFVVRHKTGAVTGVRNDAGLITYADRTLAVCIYTKNGKDTRWTPANRAVETVAEIGALLAATLSHGAGILNARCPR